MTDLGQLLIYGVMVLIPLTLNAIASREAFAEYADAAYMAGLLCAVWIVTNTIAIVVGPPESKILHPLIDLAAMAIVVDSLVKRYQPWKMVLTLLFSVQIAMHGAFWIAWWTQDLSMRDGMGQIVYSRYLWVNGTVWTLELVAAGWPGGRHVAGRIRARLRRRGWASAGPRGERL